MEFKPKMYRGRGLCGPINSGRARVQLVDFVVSRVIQDFA